MNNPINFKFLNKGPKILGFDFYDCVQAVSISLVLFGLFGSHLLSLIVGFLVVISKSIYKRFYPKNSFYFFKNKFEGVQVSHLQRKKDEL